MALINHETKEVHCKVLYTGPSLSGKTTTMKSLYKRLNQNSKNLQDVFLEKEIDASDKYFEFLPLGLGKVKSYNIRLHLYTRPYWNIYEVLENFIFHNLDGVAYILDSELIAIDENFDELTEVRERLDDKGHDISDFPQVFQYNKRDLIKKLPLDLMNQEFNFHHYPSFETIATQSVGVQEALLSLSQQMMKKLTSEKGF